MRPIALLLACTLLAACQSSGDIVYAPTIPIVPGPPATIGAVSTQDVRDEKPNRLATVRSIYGSPVQVFDTTRPVATEVSEVFTAALQARGMLAPTAPYHITVMLRRYNGDTLVVRHAYVDVQFYVLNQANQPVYQDTFISKLDGYDVYSDISDLVPFTAKALDAAVDALLDKPALRALLQSRTPPTPLPNV